MLVIVVSQESHLGMTSGCFSFLEDYMTPSGTVKVKLQGGTIEISFNMVTSLQFLFITFWVRT